MVGYGDFMGNFIEYVKLLNFHTIPFTPSLPPPNLNPHYKTYLDDIGELKQMFDSIYCKKLQMHKDILMQF